MRGEEEGAEQREKPSVSFWLWKEQRLGRQPPAGMAEDTAQRVETKVQPGPRSCRVEGATVPASAADLATILQQKRSAMCSLGAASKLLQLLHAASSL